MAGDIEATPGPKLSADRKKRDGKVAQPIYMSMEFHDELIAYCNRRRAAKLGPWKVSTLVRDAVSEFMAKNPVSGGQAEGMGGVDGSPVSGSPPTEPEAPEGGHKDSAAVPAPQPEPVLLDPSEVPEYHD